MFAVLPLRTFLFFSFLFFFLFGGGGGPPKDFGKKNSEIWVLRLVRERDLKKKVLKVLVSEMLGCHFPH